MPGSIEKQVRGRTAPFFVGFQVVHVGPVAVDFLADAVAGAVDEVLAVAGLLDDVAAGVIDLPARQAAAWRRRRPAPWRSPRRGRRRRSGRSSRTSPAPSCRRSRRGSGRCRRSAAGRAWPTGRSARSRPALIACVGGGRRLEVRIAAVRVRRRRSADDTSSGRWRRK